MPIPRILPSTHREDGVFPLSCRSDSAPASELSDALFVHIIVRTRYMSSNPYMALCLVDNGNDIAVRKSSPRYSNTGLVTDIWCACPSSFGEVIMTGGVLCFLSHVL